MEEKLRQGYLFDFYGELLNEHQKKIYRAYVFEDLSLTEIAEEEGISRQGVSDLLHRCTKTLEDYEKRLSLIEKFLSVRKNVDEIITLTQAEQKEHPTAMQKIRKLSDDILEIL